MTRYLATPLRRALEKAVREAREIAEEGARDAIRRLGVAEPKAPAYLSDTEKDLRRRLRAHARALGDAFDRATDKQETKRLVEAAAYAHWHRMLFARFLAERGLLRHPRHDVAVTLEDCRELASEEGVVDAWAVAERYAAAMLPGVFRIDDPVLALDFDAAHTQALTRLVTDLDTETFQAEDSLGWTYQFWRAAEKDRVNKSGVKIGADELPAVTQLFTEPYMVRFLLHNTLGAWWAGKVLAQNPALAASAADEAALRAACSPPGYAFDMLRFVREGEGGTWRPAAGTFPGWPKEAKAITALDPCCGSGHFLTELLTILATLRMTEEGLDAPAAVRAVLDDNLFGLELDGRCVQIATFAVALTAWRLGGWQKLPVPHVAWVGAPPPLPKPEFLALAEGDDALRRGLDALYETFKQAPILGSLIEPTGGDLMDPQRLGGLEALLDRLVAKVRQSEKRREPEREEGAIAAKGMADAAHILAGQYTLLFTNVPFLGKSKQDLALSTFISRRFSDAKADLATTMLARMLRLTAKGSTVCCVSPQNWLFLGSYRKFREFLFRETQFSLVCDLGPAAFNEMNWWVARTALFAVSCAGADDGHTYMALDADTGRDLAAKPAVLQQRQPLILVQEDQSRSPDARITTSAPIKGDLLSKYAASYQGISPADAPRFGRAFWEPRVLNGFVLWQSTVDETCEYGGRSLILKMGPSLEEAARQGQAFIRGADAWGKTGVVVRQMRHLPATIYSGQPFDTNVAVVVPHNIGDASAIWTFCTDAEYQQLIRKIDKKVNVTNATLVKVPFDAARWRKKALEKNPTGLPEPYSEDPTQWLFHGHPAKVDEGTVLHVALARLCGYRWPAETDKEMRLSNEARAWIAKAQSLPPSDKDGILAVPPIAGEKSLADRLRAYLAACFGADWSDALERRLVAEADEVFDKKTPKDASLEAWLRDRAFRQHCRLFHDRPFLWQIWDGLKDGFSIFVHYHRLDQANLRKLTYTTLGDWLTRAKAEKNDLRFEKGRELQQLLEKIIEGEPPYDIFVRWKALEELPLGWDPDLDDGVRMNIRPFVKAGILRDTPKIKWTKDRGKDLSSAPWYPVFKGERINDHHTTLQEKREARARATTRRITSR